MHKYYPTQGDKLPRRFEGETECLTFRKWGLTFLNLVYYFNKTTPGKAKEKKMNACYNYVQYCLLHY